MKIQDQVNLLGKAQEQLSMLVSAGDREGICLAGLILLTTVEKYGWANEVRHNASLLRKLRAEIQLA